MEVVEALRTQADACDRLGSPMYAELLELAAADHTAHGPTADVLAGHEDDPGPSALALRMLGSVHRLVLDGRAPGLAPYYPIVGGRWDADGGWPAFRHLLATQGNEIRRWLSQPPQTNEVGRAAALMGGLLSLGTASRRPVRLFEIGASAGLNLRADQFAYGDQARLIAGPEDSPVRLLGAWLGRSLRPWPDLAVVERAGCDTAPVEPTSADGELTLMSYVWPDMPERVARLRGAVDIARRVPATVEATDAVTFLRGVTLTEGTTTVLWHSVMWQYLAATDRGAATAAIERLGSMATISSPLVHLSMEPTRRDPESPHEFLVALRVWPGGELRVLGTAAPHGIPVTWE